MSDHVSSKAAYSRLITEVENSHAIEESQDVLLRQAMTESFISDDTVAIDSTPHIK